MTDAPEPVDAEALLPELMAYARRTLRHWPKVAAMTSPEDLVQDVWARVLEKQRLPATQAEARRYLRTCILNEARSLHRKPTPVQTTHEPERFEDKAAAATDLSPLLERFRELGEAVSAPWITRSKVGLYAVFLLDLRLSLAALLGRRLDPADVDAILGEAPSLSGLIAELLRWSEAQARQALREAWCCLGELWPALSPRLDEHPHALSADEVSAAVTRLSAPASLSPGLWYKWLERARDEALERYGQELWDQRLARLLGARGEEMSR